MRRLTIVILLLAAAILLIYTGYSYAGMDDRSDRLSNEQSSVFSPGYINVTKQHTDAIINQVNPPRQGFVQRAVDYIKNKLSKEVREDNADRPVPELKKKGSGGESTKAAVTSKPADTTATLGDAQQSDQRREALENRGITETTLNNGNVVSIWMQEGQAYFSVRDGAGNTLTPAQEFGTEAGLGKNYVSDVLDTGGGTFAVTVTSYDYTINDEFYKYDAVESLKAYNSYGGIENEQRGYGGYEYLNFKTGERSYYNDTFDIKDVWNVDVNRDGYINSDDTALIGSYYGSSINNISPQNSSSFLYCDLFKDGVIDDSDIGLFGVLYTGGKASDNLWVCEQRWEGMLPESFAQGGGTFNPGDSPFKINYPSLSAGTPGASTGNLSYVTSVRSDTISTDAFEAQGAVDIASQERSSSTVADFGFAAQDKVKDYNEMLAFLPSATTGKDALAAPATFIFERYQSASVDSISMFSDILKNPTEDQKMLLDIALSVANETKNLEQETGSPEAIKKASEDLLQMVAAVLIAQAIPDLLREGDVANIKSIFQELDARKGKIVLEYQELTKPYYDETVKDLSDNMGILKLKNILSNNMTKKELEKLPRNEIDKILQKLKNAANKTKEMELILKKEEEARAQYLEPNKKLFEEQMKGMMKDFTQRLSKVLEEKGVSKKK